MSEWLEASVSELEDGNYLARMDEFDEAEKVVIKDGKAYKNGKHWIFMGFEFKRIKGDV